MHAGKRLSSVGFEPFEVQLGKEKEKPLLNGNSGSGKDKNTRLL